MPVKIETNQTSGYAPLPRGNEARAQSLLSQAPASEGVDAPRSVDSKEVQTAVNHLNRLAQAFSTSLRFSVHQETHAIMVKVIDADGDVIREIPPEKVLDAAAEMRKVLGLLLDAKV